MEFVFKSRIWIRYCLISVCLLCSDGVNGQAALQLSLYHQQETVRAFSGIEGLDVQQVQTGLKFPLVLKPTYAGLWTMAGHLQESRFNLSGVIEATRRFYRFSLALEYQPRQVGRWQYTWHFEPSYYADESLNQQKRFALEFEALGRYRVNRKVNWVVGARQDSRFGGISIYPVFGLESRPNKKWHHHWVFPDFYSQYQLKPKTKARLFAKPTGGNWRYLQEDGSTATFNINSWNIGVMLKQKTRTAFDLKLELGTKLLGKSSVAGQEGDLSNSYYLMLSLEKLIRP